MFNNSTEEMDNRNGFSSTLLTFAAVLTFLIMVVGIFGNFLTVIALLKCPKVRNVAAAFIISLCLADLIFCVLVLPFSALRFIEGTWTHGDVLCKLIPFIQYGNIGVSLLCIAMITINRYVMITHHNSYSKLYKTHWIAVMITFCWIFSYGMQMPTLLGFWGVFDYDPKLGTCSIMNDAYGRSSKTTLFTTAFFIPCLIIIACYTKIFWVVHKSELRLKKHGHKQNSVLNNQRQFASSNNQNTTASLHVGSESSFSVDTKEGSSQKPTRIKDQRDLRTKRNEWRITKMVLAIFLSFLVCYFPITLAKVADKNVHHPTFHIFSYIMLYLSACINPIIYVIMNKQYRKAYKTVLLCGSSRILSFVKPLSSAEEMERYRIEQQPQPHGGLSNVADRTPKYQLQQITPTNKSGDGDDKQISYGSGSFKFDEIRQHKFNFEARIHHKPSAKYTNGAFNINNSYGNDAEPKSVVLQGSIGKGRYKFRVGRGVKDTKEKFEISSCTKSELFERSKFANWKTEENSILWSKHYRHSR